MNDAVRPGLGLFLSLITAVLWGVLPLFLTVCLQAMDSPTITVYRFFTAAVVVAAVLAYKRKLPKLTSFSAPIIGLSVLATVMLVINYTFNVIGLMYLSPGSVQVLMQIAPFALMLGGVFFYKESFARMQRWGAVCLIAGLALFFNQRLPQIISSPSEDVVGIGIIVIAALTWAAYALCQKVILKQMTAMQLTLFLYVMGCVILLPFAELQHLGNMDAVQLSALAFCCLNTLIGYGAFTEALRVWYASRVSAVIALAPVFTFVSTAVAESLWPDQFTQPALGWVAYAGAALVVGGSMLAALGRER